MGETGRVRGQLGEARVIARSGLLGPLRPDKYVRMASAIRRQGLTGMTGASLAAARRPEGIALVDERGAMTWGELERHTDALAAALTPHLGDGGGRIGLLARNHRGFVESLVAAGKLGADLVLLNTAFSGPQLADLLGREHVDVLIYDQEYAGALAELPDGPVHVIAWEDEPTDGLTLDGLIEDHLGPARARPDQQPARRAAHQRHDRRTQGGQARHRRRGRRPGRDHRAGALARRGHRGGRGPDVPRVGVRLPGARRHDGQHHRDAPPLRPRADPGDGGPAPGRGDGRRTRSCSSGSSRCPTRSSVAIRCPRCGS